MQRSVTPAHFNQVCCVICDASIDPLFVCEGNSLLACNRELLNLLGYPTLDDLLSIPLDSFMETHFGNPLPNWEPKWPPAAVLLNKPSDTILDITLRGGTTCLVAVRSRSWTWEAGGDENGEPLAPRRCHTFNIKTVERKYPSDVACILEHQQNGSTGKGSIVESGYTRIEDMKEFQLLADSLNLFLWEVDAMGVQTYVNKRYTDALNMSVNQDWRVLMYPSDLQIVLDMWIHCLKTGDEFSVEVRMRPHSDNEPPPALIEPSVFQQALTSQPTPRPCTPCTSQRANSMEDQPPFLKTTPPPSTRAKSPQEPPQFLADPPEDDAARLSDPDLEAEAAGYRWYIHKASPMRDPDTGAIFKWVGTTTDIHDGKMAILERQKLLVREKSAREATRLKSEFLAVMSHEMRTPLTGVCGMIDLLKETELNPEQKKFVNMVDRSAKLLLSVIGDILDFSKIEAGRIDLDLGPFDLSQLLSSTEYILLHQPLDMQRVQLLIDQVDPPFRLVGDASRIAQVLLNMLSNAVKFTEVGEVRLEVNVTEIEDDKVIAQFKVSDTGIGMSEDVIAHLFRPFTQADRSLSRKYGGTGLGLVISNRLLELMGSNLQVESKPNVGSTFWFDLILPKVSRDEEFEPKSESDEGFVDREDIPLTPLYERLSAFPEIELAHAPWTSSIPLSPIDDGEIKQLPQPLDILQLERAFTRSPSPSPVTQEPVQVTVTPTQTPSPGPSSPLPSPPPPLEDPGGTIQIDEALLFAKPRSWRVLVAEDNEVNKLIIKKFLSKMKWADTVIVSDGVEAIEEYERGRFDLLLLDQSMPRMNGDEVTRTIREKDEEQCERPPD
ncbi:hypothetical protein BC938DRAFT_473581 [Jimgerdemannia flammicorona]|uniref:histidine kinase n=1 Tax=Jimgerdemannia flammicorona TaxID=994334 RepID=A0A433Q3T6_9FUNG|nr:hypothetical protein BC938DRAFT_473581 [Jimgerdemannia flammicorona]